MRDRVKYRCGIVSVSFRNHTPEEIVIAAKEAGLSCIEWGSDIHAPFDDKERLRQIAEIQEKYGIYCSSYGTYFRLGKDNIDELKAYIDAARLLGTDIMRVWCGEKAAELYSKEEKDFLLNECKIAAQIAEQNGIMLCMECHHGTFTETKEGMTELMTTANSPNFRMYWQPNQYVSQVQNVRYAESVKPYCKCIHVFNWKGNDKFPLSQAKILWKEYLGVLDRTDTLLLEFMPDDKIESLKNEAAALISMTEEMK